MSKSWYEIKAKGAGVAEVLIYEEIGMWGGVSAKQFARDLKDLARSARLICASTPPRADPCSTVMPFSTRSNSTRRT